MVGNTATHEIEPVSEGQAGVARKFTYKLLETVYEDNVDADRILKELSEM